MIHVSNRLRRFTLQGGLILIAVSGLLPASGCQPPPAEQSSPRTTAKQAAKSPQKSKSTTASHATKDTQGRKSLDGIPYDVWFDDPRAIAGNVALAHTTATQTPEATSVPTAAPAIASPSQPEPSSPASGSPDDWGQLITSDQLQAETKKIRNQLRTLLQNPAAYSSEFEQIKMNSAVLAAVASIVATGDESVSWKSQAPYVRDFAEELFEAAKGPGKPNFEASREAFENIESLLDGSIPVGAAEPEAERPFADVANRFYLMRRMKLAYDALKSNINTEAKLKSEHDQALHESMLLAALSRVVSFESYTSADEPDYQEFIHEMIRHCQEATKAVNSAGFPDFQNAINRIEKNCNDCHVQYRNG